MNFQVLRITYNQNDNFSKFKERLSKKVEANGGVKELRVRSWTKFLRTEILTILEHIDAEVSQKIEEVTEPELIYFQANDMWQFKVIFKEPVDAEIKDNQKVETTNGMLF